MNGLERKSLSYEFTDFVQNADIVCFAETKCDQDSIYIPGFTIFHKPRQIYKRLSGGIAICVKTNLVPYVHIIKSPSEFVLWLRVSKKLTNTPNDLIIGACYIPPESSYYSKPEAFDEIEYEIIEYFNNDRCFLLLGDFNGRTRDVSDLLLLPREHNALHDDNDIFYDDQEAILLRNGLNPVRANPDTVINNFGHRLLDFAKTCNLCILNGRCGIASSKPTCNNVSVVDYALYSFECFDYIKPHFYVSDFDNIISDVHAAIHVILDVSQQLPCVTQHTTQNPIQNTTQNMTCNTTHNATFNTTHFPPRKKVSPRKWSQDKSFDFLMNLDINNVCQIRNRLDTITDVNKSVVDEIAGDISSLLTDAASCVSGTRTTGLGHGEPTRTKSSHTVCPQTDKPYYTPFCLEKRNEYHRLRKLYSDTGDPAYQNDMITASRNYKKALNGAISDYKNSMQRDIKATRASNPKEFWKIINDFDSDKNKNAPLEAKPDDLFNHFRDVSNSNEYAHNRNFNLQFGHNNVPHTPALEILNGEITPKEVADTIVSLKNNKASGDDDVVNEYIKITADVLLPIYVKLFNIVLKSGIYPAIWSIGTVIPIFKGKGDPHEPKNYRPINLSSCVGKLFTTLLNDSLKLFLDTENKMNFIQGAFLPGSSTTNHLFALHCLIELINANNKPVFCAFLDLSAAYDKVWRDGMFTKLINSGIGGNFFNVVHSMYQETKLYVKCNNLMSNIFTTNVGIKQGCSLSCLLFALFLNDLDTEMTNYGCKGTDIIDQETGITMFKLFALLYADDTVIISDNKNDFQDALNAFAYYCQKWKLKINESKSNIIIFGKVRNRNRLTFTINGELINIVNSFKYLGLEFNKNRRYTTAIKCNLAKARRAAFAIFKKSKSLNLSVSCQLHILNAIVKPILLYGCEIFCHDNFKMLEVFYVQCLKRILCVKMSTPSYMVYAETGCFPVWVDIMQRALSFYIKTQYSTRSSLASSMLYVLHKANHHGNLDSKYLKYIHTSLTRLGLPYLYNNYTPLNTTLPIIINRVKRACSDICEQEWRMTMNESHKAIFYRSIKSNIEFEQYLDILPKSKRITLTKFRLRNHNLPVECGSWYDVPPELRTCPICPDHIGDEFHYLFECISTKNYSKALIQRYYINRPSVFKMIDLFKTTNKNTLIKLSTYINFIFKLF